MHVICDIILVMEYIIDTNIAYYLAELSLCDKNFNISKFKLDNNFKFISSISLLELYIKYKNRLDIFKKIVKSLADNNIGIMVYGHNINHNLSLTCKKLYTKPNSYLKRIFYYLQKTYIPILISKIEYLGILIGSLYYGLCLLKDDKSLQLKNFHFPFITFNDHGTGLIKQQIEKDVLEYWKNNSESNRDKIYANIRGLILSTICFYESKKISNNNEEHYINMFKEKNKNLILDCKKLLSDTCKERNYKTKYIFNKFEEDLKTGDLDFFTLVLLVEFLFKDNKMEFNDFADSTIISLCCKEQDFSVLTSDKDWQEFIKDSKNRFNGAKNSYNGLVSFYYHVGY